MNSATIYQILGVIVANITNLSIGFGWGYLGAYEAVIKDIPDLSDTNFSWLVGILSFGGLAASIFAGKLGDVLGRRKSHMIAFSLSLSGWCLVSGSQNRIMMFCGRFLHGGVDVIGMVSAVAYLGEVVTEKYRGAALCTITISSCFGATLPYIFSTFLSWRWAASISGALNLIGFITMVVLPESPQWLVQHGQDMSAKHALAKLRKNPDFDELDQNVSEDVKDSKRGTIKVKKSINAHELLPSSIPPFLLFLYPLSGILTLTFFAVTLLGSMNIGDPVLIAIFLGLMRSFGAALSVAFVQRFGRRYAMLLSSSTVTILMTCVALILLMKKLQLSGMSESFFSWSIAVLLLMTMFSSSLGMAPVPFILLGEWPSSDKKGIVGTAGNFGFYIALFLSTQVTSVLQEGLGLPGMFLVFASICALYLFIVIFFVPETNGKTYTQYLEHKEKASREGV